ncbi:MAG TPA: HYR domain-containing protein [Polyangiaceae bacterium]|nr:HYR domain-containing protein [Polyangiaceae bacterium]
MYLIAVAVGCAAGDEGRSPGAKAAAGAGEVCEYHPPAGGFHPALEWSWTSSAVEPNSLNVMMTPAVADLNEDGVPDVVFASTASTGGGTVEQGVLRALHGATGAELFTVTDPTLRVNTASSLAVADVDLDGHLDIVACEATGTRLVAFSNAGALKWRSPPLEQVGWGAPAIANLAGTAAPEIVIGRQALDGATGALLWTGAGGRGTQGSGPLSVVADLNLDGSPEVVAGNTAYTAAGAILWRNLALPDGYNAVGNFDADAFPEIVLVAGGRVYLMEHTGAVKWGPVAIPGGGAGGPPTIADYDADGQPEIGVAGASRYAVFETNGALKWAAPTQDGSSNRTGSSVFDFEHDGSAEVVYHDEVKLRIYRGSDGSVLFETPSSSCTWHEYPVIADVDADGNAEIVSVANNNCGLGTDRGVFVYGDSLDRWVDTRRLWNQHSYHITNVNDDGSVPAAEASNWLEAGLNNYRTQRAPAGNPFLAPDLTATLLRGDGSQCPGASGLTVRLTNEGDNVAAAPVKVAFYDGDPASGGAPLGVATSTVDLKPGEFQDVSLALSPPLDGPRTVCAAADDGGGGAGEVGECDEGNNKVCAPLDLSCNKPPVLGCRGGEVCNDAGQCGAASACGGGVADCSDPDGDATTLACTPPSPYPVGATAVAVSCDDGRGGAATATCEVAVRDCEAPACGAPPAVTFECNAAGGVAGDDPAVQGWLASAGASDNCGGAVSLSHDAPGFFPLGTTVVTWTATDGAGNASHCSSSVTVADTTPPEVTVDLSACCLWSPNHGFVEVGSYGVTDVCDPGAGAAAVVAVTSDEATASAHGAGGPAHCPDALAEGGRLSLRSERAGPSGPHNGRVYDIAVTAHDASGNAVTKRAERGTCAGCPGAVCVPHDQHPQSPGQTPGNDPGGACNAVDDGQIYDALVCQ